MTHERLMVLACAAGMALCVLLAHALTPPERPAIPDVAGYIERRQLIPRVARVVGELEARREMQAAQDEVLRARTARARGEAMRRVNVVARKGLGGSGPGERP